MSTLRRRGDEDCGVWTLDGRRDSLNDVNPIRDAVAIINNNFDLHHNL